MKFKNFAKFILPFLFIFLLANCSSDKSKASFKKVALDNSGAPRAGYKEISVDASGSSVPASEIVKYLRPVYITETPDEINPSPEKISNTSSASNSQKTESVIPGLRDLKDYKTVYKTKRQAVPKPTERVVSDEFVNKTTDDQGNVVEDHAFYIEDWGPANTIVSENRYPTFYVVFSQPVKALTSLDEKPSTTSTIMTITPPLKGVYRWYGSQHYSFEASEPADPSIEYTMTINPKLRSNSGDKIQGQTTFTTRAEPLSINRIWPGFNNDESNYYYNDYIGVTPPNENKFLIRFNYQTSNAVVRDKLIVKVNSRRARYQVSPVYNEYFRWDSSTIADKSVGRTNTYLVTIRDTVPHNAVVEVNLKDGSYYDRHTYQTLKPFEVRNVSNYAGYPDKENNYSIDISFSQVPDEATLLNNIKISIPGFTLRKKNLKLSGSYLTITGLPLVLDQDYTISFSKNLKDIYGQNLSNTENNVSTKYSFQIKPISGYVRYLDSGARILEAQFPHKLLFEYMNADGHYTLANTLDPLNTNYKWSRNKSEEEESFFITGRDYNMKKTWFSTEARNRRNFVEVDLNPYLSKDGYGFVRFYAVGEYENYSYYSSDRTSYSTNMMTVQVTDLGVTARNAVNKSVFLVTNLSTGKPVPNAEVYVLYHKYTDFPYNNPEGMAFAKGTSDKNGLCVINYTSSQVSQYLSYVSDYQMRFTVLVKKGNDKIIFTPNSHSSWREGVSTESKSYVSRLKQRTFMFTDRGLYKPGEIVTFRGIDRNQALGTLETVDEEPYMITCEGNWWDSSRIIDPMSGTTSENGGFYGSFKLPDDVEPGTYVIKYYRGNYINNNSNYSTVTFTVAYFEKVRSQASITTSSDKFFAEDTISATLNASYLAGGALSNATYNTTWYIQQYRFLPSTKDAEGYTFGSNVWYGDREYWSDSYGQLDASGNANISCSTKPNQGGDPYLYKAEANVTDISNQRIYTSSSFLVHPASYYVGLKRAGKKGGYPKIKTNVAFDYVFVDTDGYKLTAKEVKDKVRGLTYSIKLRTWRVVHEQSVDDTVYTRYEDVNEEVKSGALNPDTNQFNFTPQECGWYTVYIDGYDENGHSIRTVYEFYATGGRSYWYDRYNSQSINITPDQSQYNPGDTAQLLLESSLPAGDYLITVEREGIFTEEVRHFDAPSNIIDVKIASNYVPVVYVSVASYSVRSGKPTHEYGETDLDKPKGYYGVAPIFVNPYVRAFSVKVESEKSIYKPGETVKMTLTATKGGKPVEGAELTAMAVDRGVLDLINYHVPDPISYFYNTGNYPLYVSGGDSRANIMDPVTYSIKNLQGGDAEGTKDNERKDFRPTAFFEPKLITDKNGKVTCTFKLPDNLTTYRVTAFGVKDDLFALQEKEIQARNPVNVQQVQPRRLRERDTAECGVLITNLQDKPLSVSVSVQAVTPTKDTEQDKLEGRKTIPGSAFIDGPSKHKVYVGPGDSSVVYFDVAAKQAGTVELVYTINSDVLNEKLVSPILIEKTYVYDTVALWGQTTDAKETKNVEELAIPGFAKDGRGDLTFTLDSTRLGVLGSSVNYLFDYPYGCLEQQSSRVLPLIVFADYIDVFGLNSKVSSPKSCVISYTKKWKEYQHANGGFPYWPDNRRDESYYVSLRLAHIYALGKIRGYTDKELGYDIKKLTKYLKANISDQHYNYTKAYYCYVLKLLGDNSCEPLLDSLNKIKKTLTISEEALVAMAYSYGDAKASKNIGKQIAKDLRAYLQPDERTVTIVQKDKARRWYWYDDETQQLALLLQMYSLIDPNDKMVDRLLLKLLKDQKKGYWQSTVTTAQVLDAIYTYIQARKLDDTDFTATVTLNGKEAAKESFKGIKAKPKTLKLPFESELVQSLPKDKILPVSFNKSGPGYLFYALEMKYALPDEMQNQRDEGIKIDYLITDYYTGEVINTDSANNPVITLKDGRTYKATIRITSKRDRDYLALRCPVPSGVEILDKKFVTIGADPESGYGGESYYDSESYYYDYYDYRDYSNQSILDNEVQYFWDSFYPGTKTVSFTFRATRRGVYPTPPVQGECMYEPEVFGRSDGYLIKIE